jgi:PAS domain S-box-containing protein
MMPFVRDALEHRRRFAGRVSLRCTGAAFVLRGVARAARGSDKAGRPRRAWSSIAVHAALLLAVAGVLRHAFHLELLSAGLHWDGAGPQAAVAFLWLLGGFGTTPTEGRRLWVPWRRDPRGRRIMLASAAVMAVVILAVGALIYRMLDAEVRRHAETHLVSTARTHALAGEGVISDALTLTRTNAQRTRMRELLARIAEGASLSGAEQGYLASIVRDLVASSETIEWAVLLDSAGNVVAADGGARVSGGEADVAGADEVEIRDAQWSGDEFLVETYAPLRWGSRRVGSLVFGLSLPAMVETVVDSSGLGATGEIVIGRSAGDSIEFVLPTGPGKAVPDPVPWDGETAEPMRRALMGESGLIDAMDYRGVEVAAAYLPLRGTGWGLVAKMDKVELLAPARRAAVVVLAATLVAAVVGVSLLWLVVGPLVGRLAMSERFVRTVVDSAPLGLFTSKGGDFTFVNRFACDLLGRGPEGLLGDGWVETIHPEDRERVERAAREAVAGGGVFREEFRVVDSTGRRRWVSAMGVPVRDESGRIVHYQGFVLDVHERRKAEESLRIRERQQAAVARLGMRALGSDLAALMDEAVALTASVLGADRCEILELLPEGESFLLRAGVGWREGSVGHATVGAGGESQAGYTLLSNEPVIVEDLHAEARFSGADLHLDHGVVSGMSVVIPGGQRPFGVLGVHSTRRRIFTADDVNFLQAVANLLAAAIERREAEAQRRMLREQLLRAQRLETVGRLAGGIAHDFNNLLTVVMGNSELLLEAVPEGEENHERVREIWDASQRAASLTRQLLAFSRKQILDMRVLDLNEVIAGVANMLIRLIGEDIRLEVIVEPGLWRTRADPGQIEQIIANLVINARDAMPTGGKLTIETSNVELDASYASTHVGVAPGRYVLMAISDSGAGMTDEVKERIFEPFFTTKGERGTGLGLSTVYGIVKQHGGNIWVYSEVDTGTTIKVYLPATDEPAGPVEKAGVVEGVPRGNETILVVEDDEAVRAMTCRALERQGYTVLAAGGAREALQIADAHAAEIALLVTDVVMPDVTGAELAKLMSERRPGMKVLYVSGYADNSIVNHGILEEGVQFLQKPFSPESLARKVRSVLDAAAG